MSEENMICNACALIDGPANVRPQPCTYCGHCNAWLCDRCIRLWWRRPLAAFLSRLKRRQWVVLPLLLAVLAIVQPAHGQSACGAGLQAIPAFNVSDNLNKAYQGACWDPVNHLISLPLTAIGGGTVTHTLGPLTNLGLILGNGGNDIKAVTGTSGGVPYWQSSTTINSSPALGTNQLVFGGGAGSAPLTDPGFLVDRSAPTVSNLELGVSGSATGQLTFFNTGTGFITMRPATTGALGTPLLIIPALTGTLAIVGSGGSTAVVTDPTSDQTILLGASGTNNLIVSEAAEGASVTISDGLGAFNLLEIHSVHTEGIDIYAHNAHEPVINEFSSRGTQASPTAVLSGDGLGRLATSGYDGTAYSTRTTIDGIAAENWDSTHHGTYLTFATNTIGAAGNLQERFRVNNLGLTLALGIPLDWNTGVNDAGISRLAAASLAVGNGTQGDVTGKWTAGTYATGTNCSNAASPATCGSAAAGVVAVPTGATPTLQINTSAVTSTSRIFLEIDESSTIAATTCNTTLSTLVQPVVTARNPGVSFTIQINATLAVNPACVSYNIIN